ncbi:hypothetical protein VNO77_27684 [Canavalia gladiata]|uniref:Uncharacterized protein n=1 Tax=Canavalia gladiata TaxID=3824 RepID=A0AAN9KW89_CANGL
MIDKSEPPKRPYHRLPMTRSSLPLSFVDLISTKRSNNNTPTIVRRSDNFKPSIWTYDFIQSLSSEYKEEKYLDQSKVLREEVRIMFGRLENHLDQLEFIDELQRLGVAYHFTNEIKNILDNIYKMDAFKRNKNLRATALEFRLLRQHGYDISTDVFGCFQDEMGNFKKSLSTDVEGMLSLYEASFHLLEGETILDEARDFTSQFLKEYLNQNKGDHISLLISHALELPLHWRVPRWEAQWFINACDKKQNISPALIQLAKLDFNILQAIYQDELKYTSRWDLNIMDSLPDYMKTCFQTLYNLVDEMALEYKKNNDYNITPHLKKSWADLCKSYFIEAKWFYSGYTPSFGEYMENAWISISVHVILVHAYFLIPHTFKEEDMIHFEEYSDIIQLSSKILRLANDLGTYKRENETGDVAKSIQCYMNETGISEEKAYRGYEYTVF